MRILTALLALVTLTACGAGEEVEQRDPRCDYEDDREWVPLKATQSDVACVNWSPYDPYTCQGQGCRVRCGGVTADERQADYDAATLDMRTSDYVDVMVNCGQPDESVDQFFCKGRARVLIGEGGCTVNTQMIPITIFASETHQHVPGYSVVWQIFEE
ncbi:hypothetical protein FRC96_07780 [Lujinxingia vulgaris]|uniref:Lipoprotein n=1 Tax=Lujinxingia vulgaris TaxID=2600176 RepID=A0A5C6XK30_9DELT|nr:hypothetical protein [Lujinxingia vulgaris]TXD38007.1 hypothetical protein FRC96_07780 [Lujinxingia vulgaris]